MAVRIPDETVAAVRSELDIVDIISDYVQLRRQGRNFSGLCPFHGEKTPSFSVSQEKQLYYCFGCGAGGDVFKFLMEHDGLSFAEAVVELGRRTSVDIPEEAAAVEELEEEASAWYQGHELAAKMYHHLLVSAPEGRKAREYLRSRGFTREMIDRFQIGYAPDAWQFLTDFLEKRGFRPEDMVEAGLLGARERDGGVYDRFRDRIMFPIWDKQGNVIAFGARVLEAEQQPKYLNSPESKVFHKGRLLYYFHGARPAIKRRNEAVLFEGYMDVIAAFRAGIDNGIGALGTSLSEEQARMIRRNADHVILCYDGDRAGRDAAWKNAEILQKAGLGVRIAMLPDGLDPDDYIQEYGSERFTANVTGEPLTVMEFKSRVLRQGKNLQQESGQLEYVEAMLKEISQLPKQLEQDYYLRQLETEFSLSYDALKQEMKQLMENRIQAQPKAAKSIPSKPKQQGRKVHAAEVKAERDLLTMMMHSADAALDIEERIGGHFQSETYQALAALLYSYYADGKPGDPSGFVHSIEDPELQREAASLAMADVDIDLTEEGMNDYVEEILYRGPARKRQQELLESMKQTADPEEKTALLQEFIELRKHSQPARGDS
ncbi:DNA primase [Alkalicoccus chagannorensis]|uniref:DNA primase n=1 Tax=Alkalicoccus chagannorensis TaxID=427072 RepID=UPI00040BA8FC|nr:DNA primase [Alkalicoccus chagannorensis]